MYFPNLISYNIFIVTLREVLFPQKNIIGSLAGFLMNGLAINAKNTINCEKKQYKTKPRKNNI
jgi:hypothetical protein